MQSHQLCFAYAACTATTNASSVSSSGILTPLPRVPIGPAAKTTVGDFPISVNPFFFFFSITLSKETRKIIKRNLKRWYFLMFIDQDSKIELFLHECKSFSSTMWSNSPYLNHKNSSSPLSLSHHHKNKFRLPFCKKKADK